MTSPVLSKIQIPEKFSNIYSHHRFGWRRVIEELNNSCPNHRGSVVLNPFFEHDFVYVKKINPNLVEPYSKTPWITFVHEPADRPDTCLSDFLQKYSKNSLIQKCLSNLKGIFTLTNHQRINYNKLQFPNDIFISNLLYPTEQEVRKWSADYFCGTLLSIGKHCRNHKIFNNLIRKNSFIKEKRLIGGKKYNHRTVDNNEYDLLLSSSVVFQNYDYCAASTTIVECISSETPLIVNRISPIVEYLGEEYPLYYNNNEDVRFLFSNKDVFLSKILEANIYLKTLNKSRPLSYNSFLHDFYRSDVYNNI